MHFILQWIDVIWLAAAFVVAHKPHRWFALGFVAACMLMMRLQVELMESINHAHGIIFGLLEGHVFFRGLAVYSGFYVGYLILAHYSPNSKNAVFIAASVSLFFMALFVSTIVMVL